MKSLRLGLIGLGNIGRHHATYLLAGKVPRGELVAVCSTTPVVAGVAPLNGMNRTSLLLNQTAALLLKPQAWMNPSRSNMGWLGWDNRYGVYLRWSSSWKLGA